MNHRPIITLSVDESGMASILITLISMIVIGLVVIGFTQIALHEQHAALNKVLSSQALYAAESGVNDAQHIIDANIQANTPIPAKTSCNSDSNYPTTPTLNAQYNVRYTCLLVDPQPLSLVYSTISTDQAKIIQVQSLNTNGNYNIQNLVISWENTILPSSSSNFSCNNGYSPSTPSFPPNNNWNCSAGVLRMDIVPFNFNASNPAASDKVIYLYPTVGSGSNSYGKVDYTSINTGSVVAGQCDSSNTAVAMPNMCNIVITNLNSDADGGYFLRMEAIYSDQALTITAPTGQSSIQCTSSSASCGFYNLINDQVLVDSTGQAQDVLKRIQARVPINPLDSNIVPDEAVQSTNSICKKFFVTANGSVSDVPSPPQC